MTMSPNGVLSDDVARNSIVVYALSGLAGLMSVLLLLPKMLPAAWAQVLFGSVVTANAGAATRRSMPLRMTLIVTSGLLMMVDAFNSIYMLSSVLATGTTNWLAFHLVRAMSFIPAGPIFTVGLALRVAAIVVVSPQWRTWFLRVAYVVCTAVSVLQQTLLVTGALAMSRLPEVTDKQWYDAYYIPQWSTAAVAIIPVISIGGSLWSLKIAFGQESAPSSQASTAKETSTNHPSVGDDSSSTTSTDGASVPTMQIASTKQSGKPAAETGTRTSTNTQAAPSSTGGGPSTIKYALSTTFKILTFLMLFWWIAFITFINLRTATLPFRASAGSSLCVSLCLLTESSFEWLLRKRRQQALPKRSNSQARGGNFGSVRGAKSAVSAVGGAIRTMGSRETDRVGLARGGSGTSSQHATCES
ncbi:hypothetical protein BCR44DRAFT_65915 [Catenaria anguillulae PL171]|uniref:G protein-coupled glucose receptor regulating Gpa2-domain-containing protein n=1 Tax=Catenaria anguillulae PL171 TaxID=765915 RepID=A0A1Y2I1D3_9FUNG|nr:hypothetical protein BCR44DRAFT_65915 [Catenaria anguillulae PL171]